MNLADKPAAVQLHQVDGFVHLAERPADVLVEFGAVGCQAHVAPHALEELHAKFPLQIADRVGKRGLGDEKLLGGFSVMLDLSQLAEVVQLRQIHSPPLPNYKATPIIALWALRNGLSN